MKYWGLFLLLLLFNCSDTSAQRKKVGVVLSGGGAKGAAHIGVLKVLEEAGIPIDYISGTSMGAIVGGLYSIGYTAHELDSMVRNQNWMYLLSDKVYRYNLPFSEKNFSEKYLISFPISRNKKIKVPLGFVSGQNIYNLFTDLTIGYHDSISFDKLPIPFACVSANMVDGKSVVMNKGILADAMRASMAIPGVFLPVVQDSMILVDGGLSNNFPVNIAKDMGAEITIGIDVSAGLKGFEDLNSIGGIIDQLTTLMGLQRYEKNKKLVDLYIDPDLTGYSMSSFSSHDIDSMILRGERIARANWDKIMEIKKQIGIEDDPSTPLRIQHKTLKTDTLHIGKIIIKGIEDKDIKWINRLLTVKDNSIITLAELHKSISILYGTGMFSDVSYSLSSDVISELTLNLKRKSASSLNFGFRFDSEEMASILLNTTISHKNLRGSSLSLTGRLNQNPYVLADYSFESISVIKLGASYMYKYNDFGLYHRGSKVDNLNFSYHRGNLNLSDIYFRNFKFELGVNYEYFKYNSDLYNSDYIAQKRPDEGFFSYYAKAHVETFDKKYYPEKGMSFKSNYSLYTNKLTDYSKNNIFSALSVNIEQAVRLTRRVYLMPSLYGRVLIGKGVPEQYLNSMGGEVAGRYFNHQLPFYGIQRIELFKNSVVAGRLSLRYRLGTKHYLIFTGNYAKQSDNFFDLLKGDDIWGGGIGYAYNSIIGPISINFDISNWDKKLGTYFNLGYYF